MPDLLLFSLYPWIKSLHVLAVISWMAGLLYLPRLFVYHAERATPGDTLDATFRTMEQKLLTLIMRPAMAVSWICGIVLVATPGIVDWGLIWPWTKGAAVLALTSFHVWTEVRCRDFAATGNRLTGRQYRMMNEVPTVLMLIIVVSVIVRF